MSSNHRSRKVLLLGAAPPFLSQLTFSLASFFAMAGLARGFPPREIAAVIGAYSIESIAVSWGNARWVALLVYREPGDPRSGDIEILARRFTVLTITCLPIFGTAAYIVSSSWRVAVLAATWAAAMLAADLWRFAGSRFLGMRHVALLGVFSALVSIGLSFRDVSVDDYLIALAAVAVAQALGYHWLLWRHRSPGHSEAWAKHSDFSRSLSTEALFTSTTTGLAGVVVATLNPVLSVALQLGNQLLVMPANMIAQAVSLPLTRRLREQLDDRRYPSRFLLLWMAGVFAVPVVGALALALLRPAIEALMGAQTSAAYFFLPVVCLQAVVLLVWQPVTAARRWTNDGRSTTRHVGATVAVLNVGLVAAALLAGGEPMQLRCWLFSLLLVLLGSVVARSAVWLGHGKRWAAKAGPRPQ